MRSLRLLVTVLLTLCAVTLAGAQDTLPASYSLNGITHIYQGWNNCGPATVTMALTYFDFPADQNPAAQWLKPNNEDKNVSPWQLAEYVNMQQSGVRALIRYGGTQERLKTLIASEFPVIIEAGYDPASANQGWMGHYLLVSGYDDGRSVFVTQDSYDGPNLAYSYDHVAEYWQHFNYVYIVVYPTNREEELLTLLGSDADETTNLYNTLSLAQADAIADRDDAFAWFNIGSTYAMLEMYPEAASAFDFARNTSVGLPWRMNWYQFGMFEAYLAVGRYDDVINLARANLEDGGGQFVEETYFYGGLARAAMGERDRAIDNLNGAISFNPNFTPARDALAELMAGG